jgi:hypothetical protein
MAMPVHRPKTIMGLPVIAVLPDMAPPFLDGWDHSRTTRHEVKDILAI